MQRGGESAAFRTTRESYDRSGTGKKKRNNLYANDLKDALQRIKIGGIACIERQPVGRSS